MILVTHALVGAAIGKNINNPLVIVPLSLAVHYALDSLRHGDYIDKNLNLKGNWWKVFLDLFSALLAVFLVIYLKNFSRSEIRNILIGTIFSLLPDFFIFLYWKFRLSIFKALYDFHNRVHHIFRSEELRWSLKNARNDILISLLAMIFLFL